MPIPNRTPSVRDSLATLKACGVSFGCVLDVGVERQTRPVKDTFPDLVHHLFEPVSLYFDAIRQNYANIRHHLHPVAISNIEGIAYLNSVGLNPNEPSTVTHSSVSSAPIGAEYPNFVSSEEVPVRTLDSLVPGLPECSGPYFLKIDVDGLDLQVLHGATETLKQTDVVMIEAPLGEMVKRASYLDELGFKLIDIVDLSYYKGMLWQVDMIFASKSLLERNSQVAPQLNRPGHVFDASQWFTGARD